MYDYCNKNFGNNVIGYFGYINIILLEMFVYLKAIIHLDVTVETFSDSIELEFAFDCDATHLTSAGGICEGGLEDSPYRIKQIMS